MILLLDRTVLREEDMRRIFVPLGQVSDDSISVTGDDVKHIRDVLRMKPGDSVTATCGRGVDYHCEIDRIEAEEISLRIVDETPDASELPVRISLYQALPKGDKLELIVQKAVELGVYELIPVRTARCVVKLDEAKAAKKQIRLQKIAEEAAKQSGRGIVPEIVPVMDLSSAIKRSESCDHIYIPYELCEDYALADKLRKGVSEGAQSIAVFIGPEGGFESSEVDAVIQAGGEEISLGHRILRTETAAIAVLSHLMMTIEGCTDGSIS